MSSPNKRWFILLIMLVATFLMVVACTRSSQQTVTQAPRMPQTATPSPLPAAVSLSMPTTAPTQTPEPESEAVEESITHPFAGFAYVHAPLSGGKCDSCHTADDLSTVGSLLSPVETLCTDSCHRPSEEETALVPHWPHAEGQCLSCHMPHASDLPNLLQGTPATVCGSCHRDKIGDEDQRHRFGSEANCTAFCHQGHSSPQPALLKAEKSSICRPCHTEQPAGGQDGTIHQLAGLGECGNCHQLHNNRSHFLKAETNELCSSCHPQGDWLQQTYQHAPFSGGDCSDCHSFHQGMGAGLLVVEERTMCLNSACHPDQLAELGKPVLHTAFNEYRCSACHTPHAADWPDLLLTDSATLCANCHDGLTASYQGSAHGTGIEGDCYSCHENHSGEWSGLLMAEQVSICTSCHVTSSHRNMVCSECHETHDRTANQSMIRETVWGHPVRFLSTIGPGSFADGQSSDGICVVCHTPPRSHRSGTNCTDCHPHSMGFMPNPPCGTCHGLPPNGGAHNAHADAAYGPQTSCKSCHGSTNHDGRLNLRGGNSLAGTTACDDCHGSGRDWAKANWGTGNRADCLPCHNTSDPAQINGIVAPATDTYWASSGHGLFGQDCTACHNRNSAHISDALGDTDRLLNTGDALCQSCHGAGGSASGQVSTHGNLNYDSASQSAFDWRCADCHDSHGSANNAMIDSTIGGQTVAFTAATGADSYDESDPGGSNRDDLCATCHTSTAHNRTPNNEALVPHNEGDDCITCHNHDPDGDPATTDGFMPAGGGCDSCHGQPPPPAAAGYGLDETQLHHARHAAPASYAIPCTRCHDDTSPAYIGHNTMPRSFQDVAFDSFNPGGSYAPAALQCSTVLCHSDGAASRETPGTPTYSNPAWTDPSGGACDACHGDTAATLTSGSHPTHLNLGITDCAACHIPYGFATHVDGNVQFSDGEAFSTTTACDGCHSPGGAVDGVVEAKSGWTAGGSLSCEGCHDAGTSIVEGVSAPDIAGDGVSYGYTITGHGRANFSCATCHEDSPIHFDSQAQTYSAAADNFLEGYRLQANTLNVPLAVGEGYAKANWALCYACHDETSLVGLPAGYSNALTTHSSPPPAGYPISVTVAGTAFRNESGSGFNLGNVPANIHWDHLDMLNPIWDSDGDGTLDSYPGCGACHDVHGVNSVSGGTTYPAMTMADIGITYGSDATGEYGQISSLGYIDRCSTCHLSGDERYYRAP